MNRKAFGILGVLFLAAALLAVPAPAKAEMYIEAYLGANTAATFDKSTSIVDSDDPADPFHGNLPGGPNAAVIGGLKIGTWFVPTGFLGYSYPECMKYFGFYTDFSYHRLDARTQQFGIRDIDGDLLATPDFKSEGTVATWAFMFAARYGFFPDSEVPFGRLQPYVAVGPAVMFSSQRPVIQGGFDPGSQSSVDLALAVDAGLRYMCLKNVSVDLSMKYRYAQPSYRYSQTFNAGTVDQFTRTATYSPTFNLFSFQLGVAYHF